MMLSDILLELKAALLAKDEKKAEKLYCILEKSGMDRYSANTVIKSGVLNK